MGQTKTTSDDSIVVSYCPIQYGASTPAICLKLIEKAQLHCLSINADDPMVVLVRDPYGASAAATYAGKTSLKM